MFRDYIIRGLFFYRLIVFSFFPSISHAQQTPEPKPTIFKYSNNDPVLALNLGGGFGASGAGLLAGMIGELDVYHIYAGGSLLYEWQGKYTVTSNSILLGYRYRTLKYMFTLSSGLTWQKYRCVSGVNADCYDYIEETIRAFPVNFSADWILSDKIAIGCGLFHIESDREDTFGAMFQLKYGSFREN